MKLLPALFPVCALLLPCALSAQSFEGKVTLKMTSPNSKDGSQSMQWEMKPGFMRMNITSAKGGSGGMIMDFANHQMLMLMPQQQMYMVMAIPTPPPRPQTAVTKPFEANVQVTTDKETILGYECTKIIATGQNGNSSEIWVTDQLGTFYGMSPGGGGPGHRGSPPAEWEAALKGKAFFPMRVVTTVNGSQKFRLDVTAVEKMSLPDSDFTAPQGWRKFDLGGFMGGAMQGGFPGARPQGGDN